MAVHANQDITMQALINIQIEGFNQLGNAFKNYKKSPKDRITESYIEVRLEKLEQMWQDFSAGHKQLMGLYSDKPEYESSAYVTKDVYGLTDSLYVEYKTELKSAEKIITRQLQEQNSLTVATERNAALTQIKLPKIIIPSFSGKYTEWITFRDLFESLVHNNVAIDNVQKMHYLKGYLIGEAEQLLRHTPISEANYEKCWNALKMRYNNKRFICQTILKRFLSQRNSTCESALFLKELINTSTDCLQALQNINIDVSTWDVMIIHLLTLKLDPETRKQWELTASSDLATDELPTFEQFKTFCTNRYRALEFVEIKKPFSNYPSSNTPKTQTFYASQSSQCPFCSEPHRLIFCKQFARLGIDSRRGFVQNRGLCFNCLGGSHSVKLCQNPTPCRLCKRRHHTLLHTDSGDIDTYKAVEGTSNVGTVQDGNEATAEDPQPTVITSCFSAGNSDQVLLATAVVNAMSRNGQFYPVRALLDQGSQGSFITESTAQFLGLKKETINGNISGLGGENNIRSKAIVTLTLRSVAKPEIQFSIKAFVLNSVTTLLPAKRVVQLNTIDIQGLQLADPNFQTPNKIDILLGAEVYSRVIAEGIRKNKQGTLVAQATSLGWILSGVVKSAHETSNLVVLHTQITEDDVLKRFWEMEAAPVPIKDNSKWTQEEKKCEELFTATTTRDEDGRYVVKLPFHSEDPGCKYGRSREVAENRFYSLENRLNRNPELKNQYKEVIKEYIELGHMEKVPEDERYTESAVYLPHHAIVKQDRDTTKVRVVFDASCKGKNGISLNDDLMIGPRLQPDLRHLVLRWRSYPVCLVSDIVKMYRQVKVKEEDADFQRILWRDDSNSELQHYRIQRVTFGTACAPYQAVKALQQVAHDEGHNYPLAAKRVLSDFYVDDLMTGCQNDEEGIKIYKQMNSLLAKAGFCLQKWATNSSTLLEKIKNDPGGLEIGEGIKIKEDEIIKILGLSWNRNRDDFQYTVTLPAIKIPITKRNIIADISRLFDPLGWVAPSVILAKNIIQKLWLAGIAWDEKVPTNLAQEWCTYRQELVLLTNIRIPRWMGFQTSNKGVELHGFSDASKIAFAAVVYIRVITEAGDVTVTLVSAKTKVSPIKQVSIPRLELCGAVLLTRLLIEIADHLEINKNNIHAWTDSTVVLAWLNSHPNKWKTFVANRVSEILMTLDSSQWSHVASKLNPADYASRGLRPSELLSTTMWFNGPEFLRSEQIEYDRLKDVVTDLEMAKTCHNILTFDSIWDRFSTLTKLIRVLAYCRRFIASIKCISRNNNLIHLTNKELQETLNVCIRQCQLENFEDEYKALKEQNRPVSRNSTLKSLNPFLDENNIIRVGGRLENTPIFNQNRKHPIILPKRSKLTQLIIADAHMKTCHGPPQLMQNYINSKYWILGSKNLVSDFFRKCVKCLRHSATKKSQLMGQLPAARVTPTRPFMLCGVDYAGPINLRASGGRGRKSFKGYICLFVCMCTRAVHIEAVSSLTTEGFLQAFRRMVARRGHCAEIWSDNGTNFLGASRELKALFKSENSNIASEVAEALATNGTTWHFIPPHAPNFGGLWEAGIKSVKYHLKRVIGNSTLTYEEMSTVLIQIEACLNSRPLYRLDNDPENINVLTPGHFLIGEPLLTVPDRDFLSSNINSLRRWQLTQRMLQHFWRRWSHEYLTRFLHRYRWSQQTPEPNIGDIVLIMEDDLPPSRWLLGRVMLKHPGSDNVTRVVTIRCNGSQIKRPTSKLCILPISS